MVDASFLRAIDAAVVALALMGMAKAVLKGYRSVTNPVLWFFLGSAFFLNLGAIRDSWFGPTHDARSELYFHGLELLHLSAVFAGYWWGSSRRRGEMRRRRYASSEVSQCVSISRFACLLALTGAIKLYILFNDQWTTGQGLSNYVRLFGLWSVAVGCLTVGVFEAYHSRLGKGLAVSSRLVVALVTALWTLDLSRTPIGYGLFVLWCWLLWRWYAHGASLLRHVLAVYVLCIGVIVAVLLGSAIKSFSSIVIFGVSFHESISVGVEHATHLEFIDAYGNGVYALERYPNVTPYRYGESLLALLLGWIPRSSWADKPYGFSYWLTREKLGEAVAESGVSIASSLVGDMWAGGGVLNVTFLSLGLGWLLALMRGWHERRDDIGARIIYWQFLFMMTIAQRGDIYTIFARGLQIIGFTWLTWRLAQRSGSWKAPGQLVHRMRPASVAD